MIGDAKLPREETVLEIRDLTAETAGDASGAGQTRAAIVDGISLAVRKGQVLGLIGESGSGKTTIDLVAPAHTRPGVRIARGEVVFKGMDLLNSSSRNVRRLLVSAMCYVA